MIKAVLSDVGNVIMPVQADVFVENLAHFAGITFDDARKAIFRTIGTEDEINRGEITMREYFDANLNGLGKLDFEKFHQAWLSLLGDDYPQVKQAYHDLKVPLYVLSNINDLHASVLHEHWVDTLAVKFWASNEIGLIKPTQDVYSFVLSEMGLAPKEVLFFDDLQENIDTAVEMGIDAKLVKHPDDIVQILKEYELI